MEQFLTVAVFVFTNPLTLAAVAAFAIYAIRAKVRGERI